MDDTKALTRTGDLTEGVIWKKLMGFFFPIMFGMLFQQLYNTADAIIVGKFVGTKALAAVGGSAAVIINLVIGFFTGLASGATVIIAQCFGAKDDMRLSRTVHTIMTFCFIVGVIISVSSYFFIPWTLRLVNDPADIFDLSARYLRIYFSGTVPLLIFNIGSGILRVVGDSKRPLYFLITCCLLNIVLDLLFVIVFHMGIAGAGWATVIAQLISAILVLRCLVKDEGPQRLSFRKLTIDFSALRLILYIGISAGLQSIMYSVSNLIIQAAVNALGSTMVAAWTAAGKIDGIYWVTSNAFGITICAFVGQCFGAGKYERMKKSVRQCLAIALATSAAFSVLILSFSKYLCLIVSSDEEVISLARQIMTYFVPYYVTWTVIEILSNTLRGVGDAVRPVIIITLGVCLVRVLYIHYIVPIWGGIRCISYSYMISWVITDVVLLIYYFRSDWLKRCMGKSSALQGE